MKHVLKTTRRNSDELLRHSKIIARAYIRALS